ncbi:MAG: hypothetical protein Q7R73_04580 [bacterium]|nr:hypothetical protein [bacterium]
MGKWDEFSSERYTIQDLGRVMPFLIPSCKLKRPFAGSTIEDILHFLIKKHIGAYTYLPIPYAGTWTDEHGETFYDESREYRVAFLGKERIPLLLEIFAALAKEIGEKCIFVGAGQYVSTIAPTNATRSLQELIAQT